MATQREDLAIVVVDDMKFNCVFIRRVLNGEGYGDVRVAASASEGLELLHQRPADVVLADWVMPEMDGLELTDRIRQIDEEMERYTCVVLLTARDDTASLLEAFERGVDDYLTKPPNKQELAARIYAAGRIAQMQNGLLDMMRNVRGEYEQRIMLDELTGLGNSREAERRLDEMTKLVDSRGGAACCSVIAIDNAEKIRAEQGLRVYEEILRSIAKRLRRSVRPTDVVARISESEFLVAMYYQDEAQVRPKIFKRLMQGINLRSFKTEKGFLNVNVAVAMSCSREGAPPATSAALLQQAREKVPLSRRTGCTEVAI